MTNFKWVLGVRFGTKDEFKEAITNYVIYNDHFGKNEKLKGPLDAFERLSHALNAGQVHGRLNRQRPVPHSQHPLQYWAISP
ncbi:hypothetical protein MTR_8g020965 [Medicago truncatula]|uniref:Uncharacterized protein n=1 Tax=Medicago truncatula TaxID=3880 RepID=A0A072TY59_MEDTR|nr:hypothetical protein MTR_8g020965 [Medicago truncatula]